MLTDIQLLLTGGTIDSEWDPTQDTAVPFAHSNIKPYLEKFVQPDFHIYEKTITMLDSREIDDSVRQTLLNAIKQSKSKNIIISHGTYTMAETGKYLKDNIGKDLGSKKIILVGSFYPLLGFSQSDAPFNLGYALGALEYIKPGVYVAINSQLFNPHDVAKNTTKGKFARK